MQQDSDSTDPPAAKRRKLAPSKNQEKKGEWKTDAPDNLLVFQYDKEVPSTKIAGFDLDSTLIATASGKRFATGPKDWKFMKKVPDKLRGLHDDSFKIVVFTNQLGIGKTDKPHKKKEFRQKVEDVAKSLGLPLLVVASISEDLYRKPCTGMWRHVVERLNGSLEPDMEKSFYVGDAAGREDKWKPGAKKDFSCGDRKFACNLNIKFMTPEEFFEGHPPCKKFSWGQFDPRTCQESAGQSGSSSSGSSNHGDLSPILEPESAKLCLGKKEVIVFTGFPASGKSSFYKTFLRPKGYEHVNRDTVGSWQKCVAQCSKFLEAGKSVVVDNTNPDVESRKKYIDCASKLSVPVRSFLFTTSEAHSRHNNRFRELTLKEDEEEKYKKVNQIAYNMYKSKFTEPKVSEGFLEVVKVRFLPVFADGKLTTLYKRFLL